MKGSFKKIALKLVFGWIFSPLAAQDIHLSQYFTAKMLNNPAQAGNFTSDYRVSLHHRSQWKTVSNPFVLSVFSIESRWNIKDGGLLGGGLYLTKNQAGKSQLKNQVYAGNISYQLKINKENDLAIGINIGYRQRSINLDGLAWDAQHNGVNYDPSLPTGESFGSQKSNSLDFGIGGLWRHRSNANYDIEYAAAHYYQKQGFLIADADQLLLKNSISYTHYFNYKQYDLEALGRLIAQGGSFEAVIGGLAKYRLGRDSRYTNNMTSSFATFGMLYRYQDALVPMLGYNYKRTLSGYVSYDFNISKLHAVSKYRGAWEINIQYTGVFKDSRRKMRSLE